MKTKLRIGFLFFLLVLIGAYLNLPPVTYLSRRYDAMRLKRFVRQIGDADRIVGTWPHYNLEHEFIGWTLTGDAARKIVRAVSSASSARPPPGMDWACIYDVKIAFFKGTNELEYVKMCGSLFLLHDSGTPFRDDAGLLKAMVREPLLRAIDDARMK